MVRGLIPWRKHGAWRNCFSRKALVLVLCSSSGWRKATAPGLLASCTDDVPAHALMTWLIGH